MTYVSQPCRDEDGKWGGCLAVLPLKHIPGPGLGPSWPQLPLEPLLYLIHGVTTGYPQAALGDTDWLYSSPPPRRKYSAEGI